MYLDSLEFLEEERDAWRPFEALADLTDEQLGVSVPDAHGWSGRELMGHMLAWQGIALQIATELAVNQTSPTIARIDADWETRGGEVVNAEIDATWAAVPMDELRERFRTQPGELRGYLTVVPESRWLKHAEHLRTISDETMAHYEEHRPELVAVLASAGR
jgi:Mycothiol maleylpyruvate isomerase N-terminal domain.